MSTWFFVSDLHGLRGRYEALVARAAAERPEAVLLGGDLLPSGSLARALGQDGGDFLAEWLMPAFVRLKADMGAAYPRVLVILGNDDPRCEEAGMHAGEQAGLWEYIHGRRVTIGGYDVYGYACVPPTPFMLKDWERYDVSQYVDPGCISPEEGQRTVPVAPEEIRYATIADELARLVGTNDLTRAVLLCHAPPYDTHLDRAALDGRMVDHAPMDVHVGSVALRRFIEARGPRVTLHGHIHESARMTGDWSQQIGRTWCLSAAHDTRDLALVRFDPGNPGAATRELLAIS